MAIRIFTSHHKSIFKYLLLVSTSVLLFLSDDFLQKIYTDANQSQLELKYVLILYALSASLWFSGSKVVPRVVLGVFALIELIQISYISYAGTPINPIDISKVLSDSGDITKVIASEWMNHYLSILAVAIPYTLHFLLFNKLQKRAAGITPAIAQVFILGILISKPIRALDRDLIAFLPSPTRSSLHNSINTFSYYLVKILWNPSSFSAPEYEDYTVSRRDDNSTPDNIVLIIGDSIRYDHLSINNYSRPTTPNLDKRMSQGRVISKQGISSSVATGASLPLLINTVYEPGNTKQLESKTANLFRLAKLSGYKTSWLSTMESKLLNNLGVSYIDNIITRDNDPVGVKLSGDYQMLNWLEGYQPSDKNFIIINLWGSHAPYMQSYENHRNNFSLWDDSENTKLSQRTINAYDNSLVLFDDVVDKIIHYTESALKGSQFVIITSDHGESLGENGIWGHNRLTKEISSVPIVFYQRPNSTSKEWNAPNEHYLSHYDLSVWLSSLMGFRVKNSNIERNVTYYQGEKIYEDNLYRKVLVDDKTLIFCEIALLSNPPKADKCQEPAD